MTILRVASVVPVLLLLTGTCAISAEPKDCPSVIARRHRQPNQHGETPHRETRYRRWVWITLAAMALVSFSSGCRAIVKFGESRQSVTARRLSRQGLTAARQGDWQSAETLFSEALDVSGNNDAAHRGLAETLWQRGQTEDAIEHLKQAVQLSAGDPKHLQRLGRMYLELGRVDEAERQCEIALQSERNWSAVWALKGDCEAAQGRPVAALGAYHRALSLQPDYPYAQIQAAELYHQQGRHDRLLATLDRLGPGSAAENRQADGVLVAGRADWLRGIAMRNLGRHDEANQYLVAAARKNPTDVSARLQLASEAIAAGQTSDAQAWLSQAIEIDPEAVAASGWVRSAIQDPRSLAAGGAIDPNLEKELGVEAAWSLPDDAIDSSRVATMPEEFDLRK